MSDLRPNLFDTDFEQLVGLCRALLPKFAPSWTNHNLHDPGIMLIELLAWTAEAQTYSLARLRSDERWAIAALLGFYPRGPLPAHGMVWPLDTQLLWANGTLLMAETEVMVVGQEQAPKFRLSQPINLTAAKLVGVESRLHDGSILNHKATNDRTGAAYYPFGEQAQAGDRLVLSFQGPLLAPDDSMMRAKDTFLSLGVRVPPESLRTSHVNTVEVSQSAVAVHIQATLLDGQIRYPLQVQADGTNGFLRTGAILLGLDKVPETLGASFTIEIESPTAGFVGPPRILSIQPNVLPIEQRLSKKVTYPAWSNGLPNQILQLEETGAGLPDQILQHEDIGAGLPASLPCPTVRFIGSGGSVVEWVCKDDWSAAEPWSQYFSFDPSAWQIHFGNGINGQIPPPGATLQLEYEITEGTDGNLSAALEWQVSGLQGVFGKNLDPTLGGSAALDLVDLRRIARDSVRKAHAIVTSSDLELAALALPDLQVVRAQALALPDLGTYCSALADTRTLVVLRARPPMENPIRQPENPIWLTEVRRELVGRLPLGERLRVISPDYIPLRLQATLASRSGYDPDEIASKALDAMVKYFNLVAGIFAEEEWPLGRKVSLLEVRGRLLNINGVAGIRDCILLWGDQSQPVEEPAFSRTFLPLLRTAQSRIAVERISAETLL